MLHDLGVYMMGLTKKGITYLYFPTTYKKYVHTVNNETLQFINSSDIARNYVNTSVIYKLIYLYLVDTLIYGVILLPFLWYWGEL